MIGWAGLAVPLSCPRSSPPSRWGGDSRARTAGEDWPRRPVRRPWTTASPRVDLAASSASTSRRTSIRAGDGAAGVHAAPPNGGPRGEPVAVTELPRARWRSTGPMADIALQTAVVLASGPGRYSAMVHGDWEIWGPERRVRRRRRAAGRGRREPVRPTRQLLLPLPLGGRVRAGRPPRHARSLGTDGARAASGDDPARPTRPRGHGLVGRRRSRDWCTPTSGRPRCADPDELKSPQELRPDDDGPPFKFWDNFDQRPIDFVLDWPPAHPSRRHGGPGSATPRATFDDPWADAARSLIVLDVRSWPAGHRPHAHLEQGFIAPSLDLYASFQHPAHGREWLLLDGHSPVAEAGCCRGTAGCGPVTAALVASGGGQAVFRHT